MLSSGPSKIFSDYDSYYKLGIVAAWTLSFFVTVLNTSAISYLSLKKRRMMNKRMKLRRNRFSIHSRMQTNIYKPDELVVLSLCVSNFCVGLAAGIKFFAFICEADLPGFEEIISYIVTFAMFVSLIHVLLLSLERMLSVSSPFCHQDLRNKQTLYMLLVVWTLSILPPILNSNPSFSLLIAVLMISSYIILIITYAYIFKVMGVAFRHHRNSIVGNSIVTSKYKDYSNDSDYKRAKERDRRTTFSCCSIVVSYILCTILPVAKLVTSKKGINDLDSTMDVLMFIFLLLRSMSDPLVYILRNKIYNFGMILCNGACTKKKATTLMEDDITEYNLSFSDEEEGYMLFVSSRETCL